MLKYRNKYSPEETRKRWAELSELTKPKLHESPNQASRGILIHKVKGADGKTYGVIQESADFFVKVSTKSLGLSGSRDFNYIGGVANASLEKFPNYPKAMRRLSGKMSSLHEAFAGRSQPEMDDTPADEEDELLGQLDSAEQQKDAEDAAGGEGGNELGMGGEGTDEFGFGAMDDTEGTPALTDGDLDSEMDTPAPEGEEDGAGDAADGDLDMDTSALDGEGDAEMDGSMPTGDEDDDEDGGGTDEVLETLGRLGSMIRGLSDMTPDLTKNILNTIISNTKTGLEALDDDEKETLKHRIDKNGKKLDENIDELDEVSSSPFNDPDFEGKDYQDHPDELEPDDVTFNQFSESQGYDDDSDETIAGSISTWLKLYAEESSDFCFSESIEQMKDALNPAVMQLVSDELGQDPALSKYVKIIQREVPDVMGMNESYLTKLIRKLVMEEKSK